MADPDLELTVQLPIGYLADKKDRRIALCLNLTSAILYWAWPLVISRSFAGR